MVMQQPQQQAQLQPQQPPQPQIIQQQTFQQPLLTSDSIEQAQPPAPAQVHYQPEVMEQPPAATVPIDYVQQPQQQQLPVPQQPQAEQQQQQQKVYLQQQHSV